jgi:uncharacterized protein YjiK
MVTDSDKCDGNDKNRNIKVILIPALFLTVLFIPGCNLSSSDYSSKSNMKNKNITSDSASLFQYDLDNPDEKYILPVYLNEISGMAYYSDNRILCVQDEKANIYVFNPDNKEIENKFRFGKDGDYEDITLVDTTVFVVRSDGHLFEVRDFDKENISVTDHNTPLSDRNDTEGLAYDNHTNTLLIACKGVPDLDKKGKHRGFKAVYQFDLDKMKLKKDPALLIDSKSINNFQPSGLAINPVSGELYMLSSSGKLLVVMSLDGKVMDIHNLSAGTFRQPEGICFSPSGDLFIANEGNGSGGNILKFKRNK